MMRESLLCLSYSTPSMEGKSSKFRLMMCQALDLLLRKSFDSCVERFTNRKVFCGVLDANASLLLIPVHVQ